VLELFQMDTADFAGLVLPAASFLECHDLAAGYFHQSLSAQGKVMEPLGEALPNAGDLPPTGKRNSRDRGD
jgi:anaerobic selenocysteine-containing dehydrogenase